MKHLTCAAPLKLPALVLAFTLSLGAHPAAGSSPFVSAVLQDSTAAAPSSTLGVPLTAEKLSVLLPSSVYFQGRTAPLQTRNAGGTTFADGQIVWVALVDSSGYSSAIQEKYQFYLVTEGPLRVGDASLPAGAYGGGFLGDRFLLMDLGGHTVAQGPLQTDAPLRRPRPLQVLPDTASAVKLYLGRKWVALQADPGAKHP